MRKKIEQILFCALAFLMSFHSQLYTQPVQDTACLWFEYEFFPDQDSQKVMLRNYGVYNVASLRNFIYWDPSKLLSPRLVDYVKLPGMDGGSFFFDEANGHFRVIWDEGAGDAYDIEDCKFIYSLAFRNTEDTLVKLNRALLDTTTTIYDLDGNIYVLNETNCCMQTGSQSDNKVSNIISLKSPISHLSELDFDDKVYEVEVIDVSGRTSLGRFKPGEASNRLSKGVLLIKLIDKNNEVIGIGKTVVY